MSEGGQPLGQNQQPPDNFNHIVNTIISPHQQGGGTTHSIPTAGELQPSHSSNSTGVGVVPLVPQLRTSLPDVRSYVQHLVSKKGKLSNGPLFLKPFFSQATRNKTRQFITNW